MSNGKRSILWVMAAVLLLVLTASGAPVAGQGEVQRLQATMAAGGKLSAAEISYLKQFEASVQPQRCADRPGHSTLDDYVVQDTTYSWIPMTGATQLTIGDDENLGPYTLGFTFSFYGNSYTQMRVNSNGSISPTDANWYNLYNPVTLPCLPNTNLPNNSIYGWWGDLDPSTTGGGTVKYRSDVAEGRFIVAWEGVPYWTASGGFGAFTFQIVVRSDGVILVNYGSLATGLYGDSCYAGIENSDGTEAVQVWCCNGQEGTPPTSNSAIRYVQPDGLPNPPTNLQASAAGTTVTLTWTDPNQDTNGNPIVPDSILIYRGGSAPADQIGHVAGGVQTFTAVNQPTGNLTYYARAKEGQWISSPVSATVLVGNATYATDFESDAGGWDADGVWSWGVATNSTAPAPHSGTHMWGTGMTADYENNSCGHVDLNPGLRVASSTATLEFWYWYQIEGSWDGCNVKVSIDSGNTWTIVTPQDGYPGTTNTANTCNPSESAWTSSTIHPWAYAVLPIGQFLNQYPIFRFTFGSDGSITYPGFFFDDMIIWGMAPRQAIVGTVGHAGGTNPPLAGVWVQTGSDSVQTDATGNYVLSVDPGTYTVRFHHPTHCDSVVTGIVVQEGENDTLNVSLRAPMASLSVTSLTFIVPRNQTRQQYFVLSDTGSCPLHFQVQDSVNWLTSSPDVGDINPGAHDTIWVTAAPGIMQPGDYQTTIRVVGNATGSPFLVHVDMTVQNPSAVDLGGTLPAEFALHSNYPNPFNPTTVLPFDVPQQAHVELVVYNVVGQEIARPVSGNFAAGRYEATFDAHDLPTGLYFVKMTAGDFTSMGKMMLLK